MASNKPVSEEPVTWFIVKFVIIGDYGVGKTSVIKRYTADIFESFSTTIGVDFKLKRIDLEGKKYKLQIWDVPASGGRYKVASPSFYKRATGVMVVYDITDSKSFDNTRLWLKNVQETASPNIQILILGNKCDEDEEKRQVSAEQGQQLATEYGGKFMETSAKENINIDNAFSTLLETVAAKVDLPQYPPKKKSSNKSRSSGCVVL